MILVGQKLAGKRKDGVCIIWVGLGGEIYIFFLLGLNTKMIIHNMTLILWRLELPPNDEETSPQRRPEPSHNRTTNK